MRKNSIYDELITQLRAAFGDRLKTVVLFGSRARKQAKKNTDHDIFIVIEDLTERPLERQKQIRSAIWDVPLRINTIAKTPEEVQKNLTALLLDVCVDGICLYGKDYFEPYRNKALAALEHSGLKRHWIGKEGYWRFEKFPIKDWELTWEGFHELS